MTPAFRGSPSATGESNTVDPRDRLISSPAPRNAPWGLRAAASGIAATALAATLATLSYRAIPGTEAMAWDRLGPAIGLFAIVTGVCTGTLIGWGTLAATRKRRVSLLGLAVGGGLGGVVAGIIPGLYGFAGFGSLHAPYMGSVNILSSVLAAVTAFVVLWGPRLLPTDVAQRIGPAQRFGLATLAAVITVGAVGLLGGMVAMSLHLVPHLPQLRVMAAVVGLPLLGMIGGAVLGALGGTLVGLCCGIFTVLARRTAQDN